MDYKIVVTSEAEQDLERFVLYLLVEKCNEQAAKSVLDDFESTIQSLKRVAGSLKYCENPKLKKLGYRRINVSALFSAYKERAGSQRCLLPCQEIIILPQMLEYIHKILYIP